MLRVNTKPRHKNAPRPLEKSCRICGATFSKPAKISWAQWETRVACGVNCGQTKPLAQRLADHLAPVGECLEWTGSTDKNGYGTLIIKGAAVKAKNVRAHRVAYSLAHPEENISGKAIRHTCDNPPCCNPDHLVSGSNQNNVDDRTARGRNHPPKGEAHGNAKLTDELVRKIRASPLPSRPLAEEIGVTSSLVRFVRQGKIWRHVA